MVYNVTVVLSILRVEKTEYFNRIVRRAEELVFLHGIYLLVVMREIHTGGIHDQQSARVSMWISSYLLMWLYLL